MAEFQEVMRQYDRMCEATPRCDEVECSDCVLFDQDFGKNGSCLPEILLEDPKLFEHRIMAWAAEHPEPVYPTWKEWLEEQCVVVHFDSVNEKGKKVKWELTNKSNCPVPADIAKKLGIEPKEAE